jgi:hypothetical protein
VCRNHVLLEDVEYFLEKTKAKECFDMLDLDRDGKISLQVILAACCATTCAVLVCLHSQPACLLRKLNGTASTLNLLVFFISWTGTAESVLRCFLLHAALLSIPVVNLFVFIMC